MKRFILINIAIVLLLVFSLSTFADTATSNDYQIGTYTISFNENSSLTSEEQQLFAKRRAEINSEDNSNPKLKNVLCSLFGHNTKTESMTVIEHRVRDTAPRCKESVEDVTCCSRCDYMSVKVISTVYIYCCE